MTKSAPIGLRRARLWSRFALFWEGAAPAILPLALIVSGFFVASWMGLFRWVSDEARVALGAIFALSTVWALLPLRNLRSVSQGEIDRRLERDNALEHQPITAQDDELAVGDDAFAHTLWLAHKKQLADKVGNVRGARAQTDIAQRDPWALRSLAPLALVSAFAFSFGVGGGSLGDAFRSHNLEPVIPPRVDAWITPPSYTGAAPIFMTSEINSARASFNAPEGSKIVVRIAGGTGKEAVLYGNPSVEIEPLSGDQAAVSSSRQFEILARESGVLRINGAAQPADEEMRENISRWAINITPDNAPKVAFDEEGGIERAVNGALTLRYIAEDDFRIASGEAAVSLRDAQSPNARPLYGAPEIRLVLPRRNADGKAKTTVDLMEHPWAGARVDIQLKVLDDLEQVGVSETVDTVLPGRPFSNKLARALIEQRRNLALDANAARDVYDMLDLFMLYPEETIDNAAHFLGLSTAQAKLRYARTDDQLREVVDYLWEVARNIEDGGLSDAERRLKDAQQALRDALENGASDAEIEQLMAELREAMQEFMREFAEQNRNNPNMQNQQNQQNAQQLDQQSLDEMLDRLEEMAKSGAREQAMDMLSQLQDMMNNLQMGQNQQQQGQQGQNQAQQQMNELGEILRQQQELMNDTFQRSQRPEEGGEQGEQGQGQEGQNGQQQQPGQQGQQGQQGQNGQQQQGQQGQQGQQPGEQGQQGQNGERGQGQGQNGLEGLAPGQQALQDRLNEFMEALEGMGINPGDEFSEAGEAMGEAGEALGDGSGDQALSEQGNAMDALRRGAESMMNQMQQQAQQQQGQGQQGQNQPGGTQNRADRDPLGRPQRTEGPDFGDSVDVPDEIDVRRAREILEAIRDRLGKGALEQLEKDYLERLLELN